MIQRELITMATLAKQAQENCMKALQELEAMQSAQTESYNAMLLALDKALEALNKL